MFMAETFGSFKVKESAQDIFYYYRHGWRNFSTHLFYHGYFQVENIVLQLFRGSTICYPDVFLCPILQWFGVGEGQRWLKFPNVLPRHFRHDPTTLRLLRRTLGGLDDDGYSLRRTTTEWKSVKEFLSFAWSDKRRMPPPCPFAILCCREVAEGGSISSHTYVCVSNVSNGCSTWMFHNGYFMWCAMIFEAHCDNISCAVQSYLMRVAMVFHVLCN